MAERPLLVVLLLAWTSLDGADYVTDYCRIV